MFKRLAFTFIFFLLTIVVFLYFSFTPSLMPHIPFSTAVYDEKNQLLRLTLTSDEKYRLFTPLEKISPTLIATTLLQEDRYFKWHFGINPFAIVHAAWQTYILKSRRFGASTISMQLARMLFNINSKKISGKLKQIVRALQLEMHYSKNQILEMYLNVVPYGGNIEGAGAASLIYFNKAVDKLTLPEALTLSVIPQNPAHRTPKNAKLNQIRRKLFEQWVKKHPQDGNLKTMLNLPLTMQTKHNLPFIAPHFVEAILNNTPILPRALHTTLDGHLQKIITRVTQNYIQRKKNLGAYNSAVLLVDSRNMATKVLVGSVDYFNNSISGQINGTEIYRSPGSTLKPFIYGLALDQGLIHPNTILKDVPRSFGAYNPENFDYDFMGPMKAKDALILSRNIPAIYLANQLSHPSLYQFLNDAEIHHLKPESFYGLALALGGVELSMQELVSLYAMLLNEGVWHPLRFRKEEPLSPGKRLLSPEASFLVLDMLKETTENGFFANNMQLLPVSWKTGTSSGFRDAWAMGTVGPYVLAVWIGNFNNQGNPAFVGKNIAAPLFFELINRITQEKKILPTLLSHPENMNLKQISVCKASGMLPTRYCKDTELTWFIPGKSPIKTDTVFREIAINPQTGLRTCHIDSTTRFEIYEFWPSDLLKLFRQAGIQRRTPPFYEANCALPGNSTSLQIVSPQTELNYIISTHATEQNKILLTAITDADVRHIYWFINNHFLVKTTPGKPVFWPAKPGKFIVRVVDDHGFSDAREMNVRVES